LADYIHIINKSPFLRKLMIHLSYYH